MDNIKAWTNSEDEQNLGMVSHFLIKTSGFRQHLIHNIKHANNISDSFVLDLGIGPLSTKSK